jgi:hypothetical protein
VTRDALPSQIANKAAAIEDLQQLLADRDAEIAELDLRVTEEPSDDTDRDA